MADASSRIEIVIGDITAQDVDAIVNAANESLLGGGGVDGAVHRAAGPGLVEECRGLGGCPTGSARITGGHRLRARHVIHAVGPRWQGGAAGEDALLANCYRACFDLARAHGLATLAFPAISTGIYRFPLERATGIALAQAATALTTDAALERIVFVCFGEPVMAVYHAVFADIFGCGPG